MLRRGGQHQGNINILARFVPDRNICNMARNICRNGHFLTRNISATSLSFFAHWLRNIPQGPLKGTCGVAPLGQPREKDPRWKPLPLTGHQRRRHPEKATYPDFR